MKKTIKISIRIFLVFAIAILMSFFGDNLHTFFDDFHCVNGSGKYINSNYQYCSIDGYHLPTYHWGYRHYLYFFCGLFLFIVQVADIVNIINKKN